MEKTNEILISIHNVGFGCLIDKRIKHNLISPDLLDFMTCGIRYPYSIINEDGTEEVITRPKFDPENPFSFESLESCMDFDDVLHYVGKKVVRCRDNKLRVCKEFMLKFECEDCTFSFPFFLDKKLDKPAILGLEAYNIIHNETGI